MSSHAPRIRIMCVQVTIVALNTRDAITTSTIISRKSIDFINTHLDTDDPFIHSSKEDVTRRIDIQEEVSEKH